MERVSPIGSERFVPVMSAFVLLSSLSLGLAACEGEDQVTQEETQEQTPAPPPAEMPTADMANMSHDDGMLTDQQLADLRRKIPLYSDKTDEEINAAMAGMRENYDDYLSAGNVSGSIGVLALAHGFGEPGDTQFKASFGPVATIFPTSTALGMSMMTSAHVQSAVDDLVAAGAETIVVIPTTTGERNSLVNQWNYMFQLGDESAYLDVPTIETDAKIIMAPTPARSPLISSILLDHALELSTDPDNELILIIAHGPQDAEDNAHELAILEDHAEIIRQDGGFPDVRAATLQDDAPGPIRAANVQAIRDWIEGAISEGKDVIVVTTVLTDGGVHRRIKRDLDGLDYKFFGKGLTAHPLFSNWIMDTVRRALAE